MAVMNSLAHQLAGSRVSPITRSRQEVEWELKESLNFAVELLKDDCPNAADDVVTQATLKMERWHQDTPTAWMVMGECSVKEMRRLRRKYHYYRKRGDRTRAIRTIGRKADKIKI